MDINQFQYKFDGRYIINDTLSRLCQMLNDVKYIEKIIISTQLPYIFTNQPIPLAFNYSLQESLIKETYCTFSWVLQNKEIPCPILLSFNLTENTLEKNILLIFEIIIIQPELMPKIYYQKIKNCFPQIIIEVVNNLNKELQDNHKDIYHYESKVFNYPRERIWDIISNIHCYMNKNGMIKECTKNAPIKEKGEEFSFYLKQNCKNKSCKLKVNKFKNDPDSNKWTMGYHPLKGPFQHSDNFWTLIKLGENQTMVGNTTIYSERVTPEDLEKLTETKKEMFCTIESLLKNEKNKNAKCFCECCANEINIDQFSNNSG